MDSTELVRLLNVVLAVIGFTAFAIRINDDWQGMSRGYRIQRMSLLFFVAVMAFESIELMFANPPVQLGYHPFLETLSIIGLIVGLSLVRKDRSPLDGGWIKASEVAHVLESLVEDPHGSACDNPACIKARLRLWTKVEQSQHRELDLGHHQR